MEAGVSVPARMEVSNCSELVVLSSAESSGSAKKDVNWDDCLGAVFSGSHGSMSNSSFSQHCSLTIWTTNRSVRRSAKGQSLPQGSASLDGQSLQAPIQVKIPVLEEPKHADRAEDAFC